MSLFSTFSARYKTLPRAGRWMVWLLLIVVGYFGVVEPALDWSSKKAVEAERLQKTLAARARLSGEAGASAGILERSIAAFGPARPPRTGISDPSGHLSQKVNDLANKHDVIVKRRTRRGNTPVNGAEWNGARVERISIELVIECNTEQLVGLLTDLEASPDVTQLSAVRMNKLAEPGVSLADSTVMQVTLVPELWIVAGKATEPAPEPAPTPLEQPQPEPAAPDGAAS